MATACRDSLVSRRVAPVYTYIYIYVLGFANGEEDLILSALQLFTENLLPRRGRKFNGADAKQHRGNATLVRRDATRERGGGREERAEAVCGEGAVARVARAQFCRPCLRVNGVN